MKEKIEITLCPEESDNLLLIKAKVSNLLNIDINRIIRADIIKKSIDARQKNVKIHLTLNVYIDEIKDDEAINPYSDIKYSKVDNKSPHVIIVGSGPAGLFAALQALELGIKPIVLERGKDVDRRRKDLALISRNNIVDPDSNYCFGEGGAGTFSDGKLFTRSRKKGNVEKILSILHSHGAKENILYEAHPHIGTDLLPVIVKNIRETIISHGGEVHFNSRVVDLIFIESPGGLSGVGEITGVVTADGRTFLGPVILATGHSARDTFRMLKLKGIRMEPKGLAIGVRLEHPQQLVDKLQYHSPNGRGKYLPPAEYSFLTRVNDRGVYTFCMCPGGVVVPSASGPEQSAVNGMSSSSRGGRWANAAFVAEILPDDVQGEDELKMMNLQEEIERAFFEAADRTQKVPAQRMTDFVDGKRSATLNESSYAAGLISARVDQLLPEFISRRLRAGLLDMGTKKKGFLTPEATVLGAETRTSSPVRIPRDSETYQHCEVKGLFPVGEGAGWAGGIVTSAIDGQNAAKALAKNYYHNDCSTNSID